MTFRNLVRTLAAMAFLISGVVRAEAVTLFGLVDTGELFASADNGVTWTIRSTLPVRDAVALAAGATTSELFLASESGAFYRSMDAGTSWTDIGAVPASDVAALVTYPGRFLLFSRTGGVYSSTDNGSSWSATGTIIAPDVASAVRTGNSYFAMTTSGAVYRSNDLGASWTAVAALDVSNAVEVVVRSGTLYVLTSTGEMARSLDLGSSWSFVGTLSQSGMSASTVTTEILATTEGGEVAASADGVSWTWRGVIGQLTVRALATDIPITTSVDPSQLDRFHFAAPWPNPARGVMNFALELPRRGPASIEIYDSAGRRVGRPVQGDWIAAGRTTFEWRPQGLRPGLYHALARTGNQQRAQRIVWLGAR